jgi:hypothetical protein
MLLLAGCDGVFGLTVVPEPRDATTAGDARELDARPGCFLDTFSNGSDGLAVHWDRIFDAGKSDVLVENGKLVIKLAPNVNNYASAITNTRRNLTQATVTVRVDSVVGDGDTETFLDLELNPDNFYTFDFAPPRELIMRLRQDGTNVLSQSIDYDPVAHRYWRMQHESSQVKFLTSVNGADWVLRYMMNAAIPVNDMVVRLGAGAYNNGAPDPRGSTFDDVEVCTP